MFLWVMMLKVCEEERGRISKWSVRDDGASSSIEMPDRAISMLTFNPFRNNLLGGVNS